MKNLFSAAPAALLALLVAGSALAAPAPEAEAAAGNAAAEARIPPMRQRPHRRSAEPAADADATGPIPLVLNLGTKPGTSKYKVDQLPDVNFAVPRNWAGQVPVGGPSAGNATFFFWLWETESLFGVDDLILWYSGGPAVAGAVAETKSGGPIVWPGQATSPQPNPYRWTKASNVVFIDAAFGAGYATGSDDNQDTWEELFANYVEELKRFFELFPELKSKKLHFMGESAAGYFLPYIVKRIQDQQATLGFKATSLSLGNPIWYAQSSADLPAYPFVKEIAGKYPTNASQIPQAFVDVMRDEYYRCGFDQVQASITYPQTQPVLDVPHPPAVNPPPVPDPDNYDFENCWWDNGAGTLEKFVYRLNYTSCLGQCWFYQALQEYYISFAIDEVNPYDVSEDWYDDAWQSYLNRTNVQTALHVTQQVSSYSYAVGGLASTLGFSALPPPSEVVIPELLNQGVGVNIIHGTLDAQVQDANEYTFQNMTWKGTRGLTSPLTSFKDDSGTTVGQTGKRDGFTFLRVPTTGHRFGTVEKNPRAVLEWIREYVTKDKGDWWWIWVQ